MRLRSILNRRALAAAASVPIVALAAVGWHHLPTNVQVYAPFDVHGPTGAMVAGDTVAVTVIDIGVASAIRVGYEAPVEASGRWVVINAAVSAVKETVVPKAELLVGENTYRVTDRFPIARLGIGGVDPGIIQQGSWSFDVATELIDRPAVPALQLRVWTEIGPFVSRVVIDLDGRGLTRRGLITVDDIELHT